QRYAIHAFVALFSLVIVLRAQCSEPSRPSRELAAFGAAFIGTVVLIAFASFVAGTSPSGLFEGVIGVALRQAGTFIVPLELPDRVFALDFVDLAGVASYSYLRRSNTDLR